MMSKPVRRNPARIVPPRDGQAPSMAGVLFRISIWGIKALVGLVGITTIATLLFSFFF